MRWLVTLSGDRLDIDRLLTESLPELSVVDDSPREILLTLDDPEGDARADEAAHAGKAVVDVTVRRINGFGRLRWGRVFSGVEVTRTMLVRPDGSTEQTVFLGVAYDHMLPEDYADMLEKQGYPRPALPVGLDVVNALGAEAVTSLAATNPEVARVLHLVRLMLEGDDQIDWVAAYAALEVIEEDMRGRGLDGKALGWWNKKERNDFTATANSVEVLGFNARHGKRSGITKARMNPKEASWFIRRAAALWITDLLAAGQERDAINT